MILETPKIKEFRAKLEELPRERLLEIIGEQTPQYIKDINRIEWVFRNKLSHLNDDHGQPIVERDLTNADLIKLIDPPFIYSKELMRQGFDEDTQRQLHIASDPVLWNKNILNIEPRAYQALVLREAHDQVVLRWGRRLGKALPLDTPIPTPDGWKTMGELEEGDQVFDENGAPCLVTGVTDVQYGNDCYEIVFSDGTTIVADADHEWNVHDLADRNAISSGTPRPLQTLTTKQMSESLTAGTNNIANYSIPYTKPVQYETKDLELSPWAYGYMVVNCYKNSHEIKILDKYYEDIHKIFESHGYELEQVKKNRYKVVGVTGEEFESNFIRTEYLQGSVEQRTELLRGMCDGKGTAASDYAEIQVSDLDFAEQIKELVTSLGMSCKHYEKPIKVRGVDYGINHRIFWAELIQSFTIPQKVLDRTKSRTRGAVRYVNEINKVDSVPVKCITVDSRNRLYLAGKHFVPTHNSFVLSMYILWYSFVNENARTLVLAPAKTQVGLLYEQILELADKSDVVKSAITKSPRSPQYEIYLSNGAIVRLFTTGFRSGQKADNARGQEADMIVLDEMDYMGADDLVALMAMLQKTDPNKQFNKKLIGASTPTGQRSTYWRWNTDPKENFAPFWFPSYVNPLWNNEEEQKARRRYRNEQHFRHEIEADWGEDAEGVYPRKYVDLAFKNDKVHQDYQTFIPNAEKHKYFLGVDWDKHGAGVNMIVIEANKENPISEPLRVVYREEVEKGEFTYTESIDRIIQLDTKYKFDRIYVDQGAGEVQAELLHKYGLDNPHTKMHTKTKAMHFSKVVEVRDPYSQQVEKKRLKPFMVDNLVFHLEQRNIYFNPEDDELFLQLISYVKIRETETGNPVFAPGGEAVDHAHDALILALMAITENYDPLMIGAASFAPVGISNDFFLTGGNVSTEQPVPAKSETAASDTGFTAKPTSFSRNKNRTYGNSIKRPMF